MPGGGISLKVMEIGKNEECGCLQFPREAQTLAVISIILQPTLPHAIPFSQFLLLHCICSGDNTFHTGAFFLNCGFSCTILGRVLDHILSTFHLCFHALSSWTEQVGRHLSPCQLPPPTHHPLLFLLPTASSHHHIFPSPFSILKGLFFGPFILDLFAFHREIEVRNRLLAPSQPSSTHFH